MLEKDLIALKSKAFQRALTKIVLVHHRKPFTQDLKDFIWSECQYIEPEAWPFIADMFGELDAPPKNTAKTIKYFHCRWKESQQTGKPYQQNDFVYKEGVIGPRMIELRQSGHGAIEAMRIACEEFWAGKLEGGPVGPGPGFEV